MLANYTTYDQLFRLETEAESLEVPSGKASSRLARFTELHPYEVPEVVALRIEEGHNRYLDWVIGSVY